MCIIHNIMYLRLRYICKTENGEKMVKKRKVTIALDPDVHDLAKMEIPNISGFLNNFLAEYLGLEDSIEALEDKHAEKLREASIIETKIRKARQRKEKLERVKPQEDDSLMIAAEKVIAGVERGAPHIPTLINNIALMHKVKRTDLIANLPDDIQEQV